MRQILPPKEGIRRICGEQTDKNSVYRYSAHCVRVPCPEGELLCNTLTGELLLREHGEDETALRPELIRRRFLVPQEFDEYGYAKQLREILRLTKREKPGLRSFLIYTTLDCNARCYYCYELGRARPVMSADTARRVADFILQNRGEGEVHLHWFGGEPLFNRPVIDSISAALRAENVPFRASMISNGYLFDEAAVRAAREDWMLRRVQITLDGTEEVYNRAKAFIYREGSPYRRVLGNIARLTEAGIRVTVRMNLGRDNAEDLLRLCDELDRGFPDKRNLRAYVALLKDYGHVPMDLGETEPRLAAFCTLSRRLRELGLSAAAGTIGAMRLNHCYADNDACIGILPDGRLTRCEHETENHLVGSIDAPLPKPADYAAWKERVSVPACRACPHAPGCTELKKCPGSGGTCTPLDRAVKDFRLRESILAAYEHENTRDTEDAESDSAALC